MELSERGLGFIAQWEGFSPRAYVCPAGYSTIGYGHMILPGEKFDELDETQGLELLRHDAAKAERAVGRLIKISLNPNQFDALVSFTYNLGAGALQRSTLRMKINNEEFEQVREEWLKWCRAGGKRLKGLVNRRVAEVSLFFA